MKIREGILTLFFVLLLPSESTFALPGLSDFSTKLCGDYYLTRTSSHQVIVAPLSYNDRTPMIPAKVVKLRVTNRFVIAEQNLLRRRKPGSSRDTYMEPDPGMGSFWILNCFVPKVYGPLTEFEFIKKRKELGIRGDLKLNDVDSYRRPLRKILFTFLILLVWFFTLLYYSFLALKIIVTRKPVLLPKRGQVVLCTSLMVIFPVWKDLNYLCSGSWVYLFLLFFVILSLLPGDCFMVLGTRKKRIVRALKRILDKQEVNYNDIRRKYGWYPSQKMYLGDHIELTEDGGIIVMILSSLNFRGVKKETIKKILSSLKITLSKDDYCFPYVYLSLIGIIDLLALWFMSCFLGFDS